MSPKESYSKSKFHQQCWYRLVSYDFEKHLDKKYLVDTLVRLLKVDCAVPLGPETLMEPDDPKLVHYVQNVIRPELQKIGVYDIMEMPKNQIAVKMGSGEKDASLLIVCYTPVQHNNRMKDPFSGKIAVPIEYGITEPCAWGQGAGHQGNMTAMLTLLRAFVESDVKLKGTLFFAVNNEGRSSHECSWAMIPKLNPKPNYALLLSGGGNKISVGNRGRVDVLVHIKGKVTHSSRPETGLSAIDGAVEVLNRVKKMKFTKTHPKLGGLHCIPYQLIFDPIAPHTLPECARIKLDRRLLPGDDVDEAVKGVEEAIGDMSPWEVTVKKDVVMLPRLTDPQSGIVRALQKAISSIDGKEAPEEYSMGSYDQGGPTALGIQTVSWGRVSHSTSLMGDCFASPRGIEEEARILGRLVIDMLG